MNFQSVFTSGQLRKEMELLTPQVHVQIFYSSPVALNLCWVLHPSLWNHGERKEVLSKNVYTIQTTFYRPFQGFLRLTGGHPRSCERPMDPKNSSSVNRQSFSVFSVSVQHVWSSLGCEITERFSHLCFCHCQLLSIKETSSTTLLPDCSEVALRKHNR